MRTGMKLTMCAAALLPLVSGCAAPRTSAGIATTEAVCSAWRSGLPSRSVRDTEQTKAEIGALYDDHLAACGGDLPERLR